MNKKILLINGPNLNMLGQRENHFYGKETMAEIETLVAEKCTKNGFEIGIFQSNIEGEICTFIQQNLSICGIIINETSRYGIHHEIRHLFLHHHDCGYRAWHSFLVVNDLPHHDF